ncbi:MAG TPA: sigma-70 family RNA polymerase sigma factor [Ktedonobacterales bacterium]|nr:sigma-70 family RNA polymerase sigma factor [Ktedonobacterales bacterium]
MSAIRTQPARASGWASALWPGLLSALAAGDPDAARHHTPNSANTPDAASAANASEPTAPLLESFETFFQHYEQDIFGYLWRMTGEEQAAYDLSQETFLRAWQRFERIRGYDQPGAWLFRVATNLALNHLSRRRLAARILGPLGTLGAHTGEPASDSTARLADDAQVREILLALPPRPRAVLVLHDAYGFSTEEIGDTLGMTLAAVRMMLCRAHRP